jgi:hypothetical protein
MFADVVHSMDIAAAVGAERLREIMAELADHCAAVVQRYGGTVDKFTGDGIMAIFGAQTALEDHAVRACLAALGIQDETVRLAAEVKDRDGVGLQLRVGLTPGHRHRSTGHVRRLRLSLAAELGLVPLGLGGVLGHRRPVEPLLDITAEAVRGQLREVEGQYRHRCQDLHGPSAAVDLHHQRTERLIVFGAQRRQVPAGIRELAVDVGHLQPELVGRRQVVGRVGHGFLFRWWTNPGAPMPSPVVPHTAQRHTSDERTTGGSTGHHQLPGPAA